MKIVINKCYGGFGINKRFFEEYGIPYDKWGMPTVEFNSRKDKRLIEFIEKNGSEAASKSGARLSVVDIPNGAYYRIREYDGIEWIECRDDIDWEIAE